MATATVAFDDSLSPEAVREAYFIATGNANKRNQFFGSYTHNLLCPETGPNISDIQIETPFASVVQDIATRSLNYRAPDAVQDFYGKPGVFRVRTVIDFTPTYPAPATTAMQLGSFWNDFDVHLWVGGSEVQPRSVSGTPIWSDLTVSGYIGAIVTADYDPDKVQSGPVTVVVTGPDGARAESDFDLDNLR